MYNPSFSSLRVQIHIDIYILIDIRASSGSIFRVNAGKHRFFGQRLGTTAENCSTVDYRVVSSVSIWTWWLSIARLQR